MSWKESQQNCPETYIISYQLVLQDQCRVSNDFTRTLTINDITEGTSTLLEGMEPYSTYNVSIQAINSAGEGIPVIVSGTTSSTS